MQLTMDLNKAMKIYIKRSCLPVKVDHCQISCQTLFVFFAYPCTILSFYTLWHKLPTLRVAGALFCCEGWFPLLMTDSSSLDTGTMAGTAAGFKQKLLGWI